MRLEFNAFMIPPNTESRDYNYNYIWSPRLNAVCPRFGISHPSKSVVNPDSCTLESSQVQLFGNGFCSGRHKVLMGSSCVVVAVGFWERRKASAMRCSALHRLSCFCTYSSVGLNCEKLSRTSERS